ncbi:unnamed protein product [Lactuca virosa]|uniref:Reverse transcriptase zinc-binding domain-containing protein n=1 Tax=Lactuca virosa TaxID=75947 RepID=A0AAU9NJN6_9ASTR|nr:unnamed protein product [Lactuca virosa]
MVDDRWVWLLDSLEEYFVASSHSLVDGHLLQTSSIASRWVNLVPIKVNVFSWKLVLNRFPTRFTLSKRGLDIPSLCCPICNIEVESVNHLFFPCLLAVALLEKTMG